MEEEKVEQRGKKEHRQEKKMIEASLGIMDSVRKLNELKKFLTILKLARDELDEFKMRICSEAGEEK